MPSIFMASMLLQKRSMTDNRVLYKPLNQPNDKTAQLMPPYIYSKKYLRV